MPEKRIMTPKEWVDLPELQRPFYQDLKDKGLLEITLPVKKGPFENLIGKEVQVMTLKSVIYFGVLSDVFTYEVVLDEGKTIIMKHAILAISEDLKYYDVVKNAVMSHGIG
jgi:hypothetical protein